MGAAPISPACITVVTQPIIVGAIMVLHCTPLSGLMPTAVVQSGTFVLNGLPLHHDKARFGPAQQVSCRLAAMVSKHSSHSHMPHRSYLGMYDPPLPPFMHL
jgi:hypothetical protein